MKTIRDYYFSDAYTATATVLQLSANGGSGNIVLSRSLFVPQGGGQPADGGTIGGVQVTHVEAPKEAPDMIIHTVASLDALAEGADVELRIDVQRRQLHSRLHTAGHLIAALVEQILLGARACAGHHWPGEARVEFLFEGALPENLEQRIKAAIADTINVDLAVRRIQSHEGDRYIQIGDFPALRCGGTHCGRLKELGSVTLRAIKMKKDRLRVGYDVDELATCNQRGA